MKRLLTLLAILPLTIFGQIPQWTKDAYREENYPPCTWYTGFVYNQLKQGADISAALKALERDAQSRLTEGIITKVESEVTSEKSSSTHDDSEALTADFRQAVRTTTSVITIKCEVKSYYDPATGTIYAFAAVRHSDLANYYQKQINLNLSKVNVALVLVDQLVTAGKKMSASRQCETVKKTLDSLGYYQNLLIAVNPNVDLQSKRIDSLKYKVNQLLIDLEQSTLVYVNCKYQFMGGTDDAFIEDPCIICNIIKQALSENGCSIVDNSEEADYELTLTAYTTQRSDGSGTYGIISYYANVQGGLYSSLTRKKMANFNFLNEPDAYAAGKSAVDAATKAFKLPSLKNKIMEKILPQIKG